MYVSLLGLDVVATGMDTAWRPGETMVDYIARQARQNTEYLKFIESQRASGVVVSDPLLPLSPKKPPAPPKPPGTLSTGMILAGVGVLAAAFLVFRKK